jgi:hypothetical protein
MADIETQPKLAEPIDNPHKYDLNRVDYEWVDKTSDKKELIKAYEALKEDNGFPDLLKAVENKLKELDPSFKRKVEGQHISLED